MKKCSKCGEIKDESCFSKCKKAKDGLSYQCKECRKIYYKNNKINLAKKKKIYRKNKKEEIAKKQKIYRKNKKEEIAKKSKIYYENNKEEIARKSKIHRKDKKEEIARKAKMYRKGKEEEIARKAKIYRKNKKEEIARKGKIYYENNKEEIARKGKIYNRKPENKVKKNKRTKERKIIDPVFKLRMMASSTIYKALKRGKGSKQGDSILQYLPYKIEELKAHLESLFDKHMNWGNYGSYWHLDHIIPQSKLPFDSMDHPNFQKCWALENLQPLEKYENMRKGAK